MSVEELQKIISPKFTHQTLVEIINSVNKLTNIEVENIKIEDTSSKKGDSYLSNICRFTIEAKGKNTNGEEEKIFVPVITKYLPKNLARRKTYRSVVFFENESIFYEKVWKIFENFTKSKQTPTKFNIPKVLSSWIDGSNDYISMLDLSYQNFKNIDRGFGFDYDHTIAILELLAGFHSLSLALKNQQPQTFEKAATSLKETYFIEKYRNWYEPFQKKLFIVAQDAVEKELPSKYLEKLKSFISIDLFEEMCKGCKDRGPLAVVNHGDVWTPNFLFKYKDNKIENIALIDFQLSRYTTLANDLIFFLYSCVDIDIIEKQWLDLIIVYHQALEKNLEKFGSNKNVVTLEDLIDEIKSAMVFGVAASIECLIMTLLDEKDIGDLDGIQGDEAVPVETVWLVRPFEEKEKRQRLARMIKHAVDHNFI